MGRFGAAVVALATTCALAGCHTPSSSTPPDTVTIPPPSGGAPPAASAPATEASAPAASASASASASTDLPPELFACAADADCTAIPPGGCCFLGRLVAVNAAHVDAYKRATPCRNPRQMCPQIRMIENRAPRCVAGRCEMVAP